MRRSADKFHSDFTEVDLIFGLKTPLTESVLFRVMVGAETYNPAIRRLKPSPSIGPAADMCTLDW